MDPDGLTELSYSWGLGVNTNNTTEALTLWQGLNQALRLNVQDLVVIGDSRLIIQALATHRLPNQLKLWHILGKIKLLLKSFHSGQLFNILRDLNGESDQAPNLATPLSKGSLFLNEIENFSPIP